MLKFIKSLFKNEEEIQEIELKQKELLPWIVEKENKIIKDIDNQIISINEGINNHIESIKEHLKELNDEQLRNKKIPVRAEQIMKGNKSIFIKNTEHFLDIIDMETYDTHNHFIVAFEKSLINLSKINKKSNFVLNEFFSDNMYKINTDIKSLENNVNQIKNLYKENNVNEILELKIIVGSLENLNETIANQNENLTKYVTKIEEAIQKKEKIITKLSDIKKSDNFKFFKELITTKDEIKIELKKIDDEITQKFSIFETAFKKYSRIAYGDNLINEYLEDPFKALISDQKFEILEIYQKIKKNIQENKIELKEKKAVKTINAIDNISIVYLKDIIKNVNQLKRDKKIKEGKISKNTIMHDYNEFEYKLNHIESNLNNLKIEKDRIEKDIESKKPEKILKNIIRNFNKIFKVKLIVN